MAGRRPRNAIERGTDIEKRLRALELRLARGSRGGASPGPAVPQVRDIVDWNDIRDPGFVTDNGHGLNAPTDTAYRYTGIVIPTGLDNSCHQFAWIGVTTAARQPEMFHRYSSAAGAWGPWYLIGDFLREAPRAFGKAGVSSSAIASSGTFGRVDLTANIADGITFDSGQFTVTQAGLYTVTFNLRLPRTDSGNVSGQIRINGVAQGPLFRESQSITISASYQGTDVYALAAGDVIEAYAWQNSGQSTAPDPSSYFTIARISA